MFVCLPAPLQGDRMFIDKCVELVERLLPAYRTPTGIPYNIINLQTGHAKNPAWTQQVGPASSYYVIRRCITSARNSSVNLQTYDTSTQIT